MRKMITMEDFSLFPFQTVKEDLDSLEKIVDEGFTLFLQQDTSTSCNDTLVHLSARYNRSKKYDIQYGVTESKRGKKFTVILSQKGVE